MGRFRDLFQGKAQNDGLTAPAAAPIVEEVAPPVAEEAPAQEEVFAPETVAEEAEVSHPTLDEMFRRDLTGLGVVLDHVGEGRPAATQGEVDRRLAGLQDEVRQIVAGAQPGQDAVTVPAPRNHLLVDDAVRGQVPAVFGGVGGDALEQTVIIPAECKEDVPGAFHG